MDNTFQFSYGDWFNGFKGTITVNMEYFIDHAGVADHKKLVKIISKYADEPYKAFNEYQKHLMQSLELHQEGLQTPKDKRIIAKIAKINEVLKQVNI